MRQGVEATAGHLSLHAQASVHSWPLKLPDVTAAIAPERFDRPLVGGAAVEEDPLRLLAAWGHAACPQRARLAPGQAELAGCSGLSHHLRRSLTALCHCSRHWAESAQKLSPVQTAACFVILCA